MAELVDGQHPFLLGRIAHQLARLGQTARAIEYTEKQLEIVACPQTRQKIEQQLQQLRFRARYGK